MMLLLFLVLTTYRKFLCEVQQYFGPRRARYKLKLNLKFGQMLLAIVLQEVLPSHSVLDEQGKKTYCLAFVFEMTAQATAVKGTAGYVITSGHSNSAVTLQTGGSLII